MKGFAFKVNPTSPAIQRRIRRYEKKLQRVLAIAGKRESRRDPTLARLYGSARVEGISPRLKDRRATVTFIEPPFPGGLHQIYEWQHLDSHSDRDLASSLAWSLRQSIRGVKS
jgi:hypothetical protein